MYRHKEKDSAGNAIRQFPSKTPNRHVLTVCVSGGTDTKNQNQFKVKTCFDTHYIADMWTLMSFLCAQLGVPHLEQMRLTDEGGEQLTSLRMLLKAEEVHLILGKEANMHNSAQLNLNDGRPFYKKPWEKLYNYQKRGIVSDDINDPRLEGLNWQDKQYLVPEMFRRRQKQLERYRENRKTPVIPVARSAREIILEDEQENAIPLPKKTVSGLPIPKYGYDKMNTTGKMRPVRSKGVHMTMRDPVWNH